MGIFNLFKKKPKEDPAIEADVGRRYMKGKALAEDVLDGTVELFVRCCTNFHAYTHYNKRVIKKYNEESVPFAEEMSEKLSKGEVDDVPESVLMTIFKFNKNEKADRKDSLLVSRDIITLYFSFEGIARYAGNGLILKPDPSFYIFRAPKDEALDFILSRKDAFDRGYKAARDRTYPDSDGTYHYPDPPTREELAFIYDAMMGLYKTLKIPLIEYTDEGMIKGSDNYKLIMDLTELKWNERLRPMINPENGQISLPDKDGVYRPAEPDYIAEMKEIDFHGVI